jgi:2-dehydro-3-deoxygluconokinase
MPQIVTFGEIMLRLNPPGYQRFKQAAQFDVGYGGGEANVAVSLAQFGVPARYFTRLPKNDLGEACVSRLRQHGVDVSHIAWEGDRIGIYYLENGVAQRPSKVIYDRAGSSFSALQPGMVDWPAVFEGASWFHWTGISPAVSQSAAETCQEAVEAAKKLGMTVSCDLNYRAKLWSWTKTPGAVMENLVRYCDVSIGNEEDADKVFGIKAPQTDVTLGSVSAEKYRAVCESLSTRFPNLTTIAITLRSSLSASHNLWSAVMRHSGEFITGPEFSITPIVDRVGGGDSFAAGLIYGLLNHSQEPERALRFAIAASCLKHTITGDFNCVSVQEVEQLAAGDGSGRISR